MRNLTRVSVACAEIAPVLAVRNRDSAPARVWGFEGDWLPNVDSDARGPRTRLENCKIPLLVAIQCTRCTYIKFERRGRTEKLLENVLSSDDLDRVNGITSAGFSGLLPSGAGAYVQQARGL
ncbi:hypothetical protein BDZ97DRAFT_1756727 [Flammula alnicola]|nr:hypothetical protein BDZ97DRAFT_1756727 [Flammula alnicola]